MVIDGHRHINGSCAPILLEMDRLGIDKTVLVGVGVRDLSVVTIRNSFVFQSDILLRTLGTFKSHRMVRSRKLRNALLPDPVNKLVLDAVADHPDRFAGFVFANPESPNAINEILRCLDAGLQGIKLALLQYPSNLQGSNVAAICEIAAERQVPVFIHQGLTRASSVVDGLITRFPNVVFIIAHAGVQYFKHVSRLAAKYANVYVDTSSYFVTPAKLERLCRVVGPRKLLFGSDVPVMSDTAAEGLAKIRNLTVSSDDKRLILGDNLTALLACR